MGESGREAECGAGLLDLIERMEGARDSLRELASRPTNTLTERNRLEAKRDGMVLALGYAREAFRNHECPTPPGATL